MRLHISYSYSFLIPALLNTYWNYMINLERHPVAVDKIVFIPTHFYHVHIAIINNAKSIHFSVSTNHSFKYISKLTYHSNSSCWLSTHIIIFPNKSIIMYIRYLNLFILSCYRLIYSIYKIISNQPINSNLLMN